MSFIQRTIQCTVCKSVLPQAGKYVFLLLGVPVLAAFLVYSLFIGIGPRIRFYQFKDKQPDYAKIDICGKYAAFPIFCLVAIIMFVVNVTIPTRKFCKANC